MSAARLALREAGYRLPAGTPLLAPATLEITPGECVAVVGPNGAGKSTLLGLLSGRLAPAWGAVLIDDEPVDAMPPLERARRIAVLGQADQADSRLRVIDYVRLARLPHRGLASEAAHQRAVGAAITLCAMEPLTGRTLGSLSAGERQRAHLARALAQSPAVLLADEPTSHLDMRARADALDLARELGITIVAVLHDLALVGRFADRVAVLHEGRVVAHDRPEAALAPEIVRQVFRLDVFAATHPVDGRRLLVFDTPGTEPLPPVPGLGRVRRRTDA